MDVVRGQDLITLAPTVLNNSFIFVVPQFGSRRNESLPAPKTGGLYKTQYQHGRLLLQGPFRPVFSGTERAFSWSD
jgi:hypothetical protein